MTICKICLEDHEGLCPAVLEVLNKPPRVCPACGTNLETRDKRRKYMRQYMANRRKREGTG